MLLFSQLIQPGNVSWLQMVYNTPIKTLFFQDPKPSSSSWKMWYSSSKLWGKFQIWSSKLCYYPGSFPIKTFFSIRYIEMYLCWVPVVFIAHDYMLTCIHLQIRRVWGHDWCCWTNHGHRHEVYFRIVFGSVGSSHTWTPNHDTGSDWLKISPSSHQTIVLDQIS